MVMGSVLGAGLFHLMTHAYFKAMLFLGSGSVIHGMEESSVTPRDMQDMMEGLQVYAVYGDYLLDWLPMISGIPPFAGFWSKDEILGSAAFPIWLLLAACDGWPRLSKANSEMKLKSAQTQPLWDVGSRF